MTGKNWKFLSKESAFTAELSEGEILHYLTKAKQAFFFLAGRALATPARICEFIHKRKIQERTLVKKLASLFS